MLLLLAIVLDALLLLLTVLGNLWLLLLLFVSLLRLDDDLLLLLLLALFPSLFYVPIAIAVDSNKDVAVILLSHLRLLLFLVGSVVTLLETLSFPALFVTVASLVLLCCDYYIPCFV